MELEANCRKEASAMKQGVIIAERTPEEHENEALGTSTIKNPLRRKLEHIELILQHPQTFGIYPETEEGRKEYRALEKRYEAYAKL